MMKSVGLSDDPCGTPWLILMCLDVVFSIWKCVPVGKEAANEPLENVWDVVLVHGVEQAVVPDFVEGLFHIHEYGRTGLFSVFLPGSIFVSVGTVCRLCLFLL